MLLPTKLLENRYAVQAELWTMQHKLAEQEREGQKIQERIHRIERQINKSGNGSRAKSNVPKSWRQERQFLISALSETHNIICQLRKAIKHKRKEWARIEIELRRIYGAVGATATSPSDVALLERIVEHSENSNPGTHFQYDAFISHASEDKDSIARPLFRFLSELGVKVWFDETKLEIGDSLRRSIDSGLVKSRFGIVVISPHFLAKEWTQYELDGLVARELESDKVILPIWHKVSKNEVLNYSPKLADKLALHTSRATIEEISLSIALAITAQRDDSD